MELDLQIGTHAKCRPQKERAAAVKKAAELWQSGDKKEAVKIMSGIFNEAAPNPEWFLPYAKELGGEYRDLVSKLYLLHISEEDEDYQWSYEWNLVEFEDSCGGGFAGRFADRLIGDEWEELRELFYDKCPECMFRGDADEPYSLKLRSVQCIECIPADTADLHELARPSEDYGSALDGYSLFEGHALVKDDPGAKPNYPPEIKTILKKLKARKLKYFPNVIFPLTAGKSLLDTCSQMRDLLQLLDHGWHFESISRYISNHPELFPDIMEKRLEMLQGHDDDEDDEDEEPEMDFEEEICELTGAGTEKSCGHPADSAKKPIPASGTGLPELDHKRIAGDEARGIEFSPNKRILVKYPEKLRSAEYEIPRGVFAVKENAFRGCKHLKRVTIPEGVMSIGNSAFWSCENLAAVAIPESVIHIGDYVFWNCKNLTEATIPAGVTEIGDSLFNGCSSLKKTAIPPGVTKIGHGAFWDCRHLTGVTIPEGITAIEHHTFCACCNLSGVTLPSSVARIGEWAFHGCGKLTEITIPEGVAAIEEGTFGDCSNLKKAGIPSGVTKIGNSAFSSCENLTEAAIPAGVTEIGKDAFFCCEKLTEAVIPAGVAEIGGRAFFRCRSLAKLVISEGVRIIGDEAFAGCKSLTGAVIPEGVLIIGDGAFKACAELKQVVIPPSVVSIGTDAFAGCPCEAELKKKYPHLFS